MRRLVPILALAAPLLAGGCGASNCQKLLERICQCTGESSQTCSTSIQDQLKAENPSSDQQTICGQKLNSCNPTDPNAQFCEWILTADAKARCGFALFDPLGVSSTHP